MIDSIRKTIRDVIRSDSGLYQAGAGFLDFISIIWKEGIRKWFEIGKFQGRSKTGVSISFLALKNLKYPIFLRSGTEDIGTVVNNVIREEYGHFSLAKEPEWMIDAGAYIGDTAVYFLSRFPNLKLIALEPNPKSYEIAKLNLAPYGERCILLKKGLFSNDQVQYFSGIETAASIDSTGMEINCVTIASLVEQFSIPHIDILKMDIEGAEEDIFLANPVVWLKLTELLIIETHGLQIESLVSQVLKKNDFTMSRYRSIWYCQPNDKKQ